jgi:hypothetical protein
MRRCRHENANPPHALALLCKCRNRPTRDRRAREQRNELAPFKMIELHPQSLAGAGSIAEQRALS